MVFSIGLFAQDIKLSENLIKKYQLAQSNALSKNGLIHDHLWLTPILQEAILNWDKLSPQAKAIFKKYREGRPQVPNELTFAAGFFLFHYTITGTDTIAVDPTDLNGNNIPDYVDKMANRIVNDVAEKDHNQLGLAFPPDDNNNGGDYNYDVYLCNAGNGVYGYVAPEDSIGDNPYTPTINEKWSYSSYMVLRNNYNGFSNPDTAVSVTIAHEYQHAIQMGYNIFMSSPIKEMCATWSEDYNYEGYGDNLQYLGKLFTMSDVALNITNDEAGESDLNNYWYSSFLFAVYMTEHKGNEVIKKMYEKVAPHNWNDNDNPELITLMYLDEVLTTDYNTTFPKMYRDFCIANLVLSSESTYQPYTYNRAQAYIDYAISNNFDLREEAVLSYGGSPVTFNSGTNGNSRLMRISADFFPLLSAQNFSIKLTPEQNKNVTMVIVKNKLSNNSIVIDTAQQVVNERVINVTDASNYDNFALIVYRVDVAVDTISAQYLLSIDAPSGISIVNPTIASVFPCPANDFIKVEIANSNSNYDIELVDLFGSIIFSDKIPSNSNEKIISTSNIRSGNYLLRLSNGNITTSQKIVILH